MTQADKEKVCKKCQQKKPIKDFGVDHSNPDGRRIWCETCIEEHIGWKNLDPVKSRVTQWMSSASRRSKSRDWKFGLDRDSLMKLASATTHCPYCHKKLDYIFTEAGWTDDTPTLDRIRPDIGYTKQNTAICCWGCNNLKSDTSGERLKILGTKILKLEKKRGLR